MGHIGALHSVGEALLDKDTSWFFERAEDSDFQATCLCANVNLKLAVWTLVFTALRTSG